MREPILLKLELTKIKRMLDSKQYTIEDVKARLSELITELQTNPAKWCNY